MNCKEIDNISDTAVFPSQFPRLLIEYQEHPEAKSLAPDGTLCQADTRGLLKRAHIVGAEFRYVGKETDRKLVEAMRLAFWNSKPQNNGRSKKIIASDEVKKKMLEIGIN